MRSLAPATYEEAAGALRAAAEEGLAVRIAGAGTKASWGAPGSPADVAISTRSLDGVLEHNAGDLTAILQAGVPLAEAQRVFAGEGQMLAVDPPLGADEAATIGGIMAADDSGPLRHRYGGVRDLVIGATVALSDGAVARSGGKVIKNVAGYDLAKLLTGSLGTLGMILEVAVRLHPRPTATTSAVVRSGDPHELARAGAALVRAPLQAEAVDLRWEGGAGLALARFGGTAQAAQARRAGAIAEGLGLVAETVEDDEPLWAAQRAAQRSAEGCVVRVAGAPASAGAVLEEARRTGARAVVRPALGLAWLALEGRSTEELAELVPTLRARLAPAASVVLDAPDDLRARVDVWGEADAPLVELMRRVKARFDVHQALAPGTFVGGI